MGPILVLLLALVGAAIVVFRATRAWRERRALSALPAHGGDRELRAARRAQRRARREAYLDGLDRVGLYQLVVIFIVASVGGLVLETLWVRVDMGVWQRRYGLIWGPFSPLYGVGAVLLTAALWKIRKQPLWMVFAASMVLGSLLEQFAGSVMETGFNATSWTYEYYPDAITKYVSLRMSLIWGLLGCVWCRWAMPELLYIIGEPDKPVRTLATVVLVAFLVVDAAMTLYVAARKDARDQGIAPANAIECYIDEHYDDRFLQERFENLEFDGARADAADR